MLLPRALLQVRHRSGQLITLPLFKQATLGSAHDSTIVLAGDHIPARLCQLNFHNRHYTLQSESDQVDPIVPNATYCLQGFQITLIRPRLFHNRWVWGAVALLLMLGGSIIKLRPGQPYPVPLTASNHTAPPAPPDFNENAIALALKKLSFVSTPTSDYRLLFGILNGKSGYFLRETPYLDKLRLLTQEKIEELIFKISMNDGLGNFQIADAAYDELRKILPRKNTLSHAIIRERLQPLYQKLKEWSHEFSR